MRSAWRAACVVLVGLAVGACGGAPRPVSPTGLGPRGPVTVARQSTASAWEGEHATRFWAASPRGAAEPSVEAVLSWAVDHAQRRLGELDSLSNRARLRGLLPSVNLSARHGQGVDLTQQNLASDLRVGNDEDLTLYASLTFDLPRLLFAREEVAIARQRAQARAALEPLREQVIALYFERRRLLQEAHEDPSARATQVRLQLRIEEVTARLDAFTGGVFSRMIDHSPAAVMGEPRGDVAPEESRRVPAEEAPGDHDRQPP